MLLVKTYLAPSSIHGLGIFSAEPIPEGTLVWRDNPLVNPRFPKAMLEEGPEPFRTYLTRHAYPDPHAKDVIMMDGDDCRYMNHSYHPNVDFARDPDSGFATRMIGYGTELTCNYQSFAPGWYEI